MFRMLITRKLKTNTPYNNLKSSKNFWSFFLLFFCCPKSETSDSQTSDSDFGQPDFGQQKKCIFEKKIMVNFFLKFKFLRYLLVIIQFGIIAWFTFTINISNASSMMIFGLSISSIIGLWALISMKLSTITALPDLRQNAELTRKGPYKIIRHPMYTAVILYCMSFLIDDFNLLNAMIFIVLIFDLILKMNIEEHFLKIKFSQYSEYSRNTWRVIPFIY